MEAVVERDDRGPAGRGARDLDRVLDRLCAGVDEERALLALAAGRELGEAAADLDVGLVRADHEALVEVEVDLLVDRGDRGRIVVAEVVAADPAGEVDVAAPVDVLDPRAERTRNHEARGRDPACDVARPLRENAGSRRFLLQGHCSDYAGRKAQESIRPRSAFVRRTAASNGARELQARSSARSASHFSRVKPEEGLEPTTSALQARSSARSASHFSRVKPEEGLEPTTSALQARSSAKSASHFSRVKPEEGLEPTTSALQARSSAKSASHFSRVKPEEGLEPTTSALQGRCSTS